jgi:long-subunit fatty acid transport protein
MKSHPEHARCLLCLITFLSLMILPCIAFSDLGGQFGMNPRSMGMGGAYTAVADDLAALYYNPAGLVQLEGLTVGAGFLMGRPLLSEDGSRVGANDEVSYLLTLGMPFTGKLKDHLAIGVSLNMPWGRILQTELKKKQDPYFAIYDASVRMLQLRFGAAGRVPWKPLSFLTFGMSIQILGSMVGNIGFYAPYQRGPGGEPEDPDSRLETWASMEVPTATFFTGGILASIGERWRVGLTYRSAQYISVTIPIELNTRLTMSEDLKVRLPVEGLATFDAKYAPQQIALGVSVELKRLRLAADLTWIDYSSFRSPIPNIKLNVERLKDDPGLRLLLGPDSLILDPKTPKVEWVDRLVPRFGAEYVFLKWLTGRAGYFFERSPLIQTDFPIYDCDKHGSSLSARASFLRPWDLLPGMLSVDLSLLDIYYVGRSILGSDVGGHVLAFFSGLEIVFL